MSKTNNGHTARAEPVPENHQNSYSQMLVAENGFHDLRNGQEDVNHTQEVSTNPEPRLLRKGRGRPKSSGRRFVMASRDLLLLYLYSRARENGAKHTAALAEAVYEIQRVHPSTIVSGTEVGRVLAKYQPSGCPIVWIVTAKSQEDIEREFERNQRLKIGGLFSRKPRYILSVSFGPRPIYPRSNARSNSPCESNPGTTPRL